MYVIYYQSTCHFCILHSFVQTCISIRCTFSMFEELPLAYLIVQASYSSFFSFLYVQIIFIQCTFLEDIFSGNGILDWQCILSFLAVKILFLLYFWREMCHNYFDSLYLMAFYFDSKDFLFIAGFVLFEYVCIGLFIYIYLVLRTTELLDLCDYIFHLIWKIFSHYYSNIFLIPFCLLSFRDNNYMHMKLLDVVRKLSDPFTFF